MADNRQMPDIFPAETTGDGPTSEEHEAETPRDAVGWLARGLKSAQLGFPDKAVADFEEAAWLDPENPQIHFNLGTAHLSMGMFEQAVVNFDRTIELAPEMSDAIGNRAVAYTALGQDDLAEHDIERAVELGAPPEGLATVIDYVKTKRVPRRT